MQLYFSCDYPAVIKLNNLYLGHIYPSPKHVDICLDDEPFIEVCPLIKEEPTFSFILNWEYLNSPCNGTIIIDLSGGYLVHFKKQAKVSTFNVLCQERFNNALITIFTENGVRLSIETRDGFFAEELACTDNILSAKIERFCLDGNDFFLIELNTTPKTIAIYKILPEITRLYFDKVDDYTLSPDFCVKISYNDILKHQIDMSYSFDGEKFIPKNRNITAKKQLDISSARCEIIPYLFLEELLIGGDVFNYLCDDLTANINSVRSYFGEFVGVMPPPRFREINEVGIVYKETDDKYFVKYAKFELDKKKISNFQIV